MPGAGSGVGSASPGAGSTGLGDLELHGTLSSRFRYRNGADEDEADLYTVLSLMVGDRERDPFTGYFLGAVSVDSDDDSSAFSGLSDTYDGPISGHIYEAYVDAHDIDGLERARLGRQTLYETPEFVTFDGVLAVTEPAWDQAAQLGVYGGRPYHVYESSDAGDSVAGLFVQARPWTGNRIRLDFMRLEDELDTGGEENDLAGLAIWQDLTFKEQQFRLRGSVDTIDGDTRKLQGAATWYSPELDLLVQAEAFGLRNTLTQEVTELDPYYVALREYEPYHQGRLYVSKGIGEDYVVDAGVDVRRLDEESDESEYNHEFERYHVTGTARDLGVEDLDVSLTGEVWSDDQSDYGTWGLDFTRDFDEMLRVSAGTFYALYKDDFYLDEEREDVRTFYVKTRIKRNDNTTWTIGYEFEDADLDDFHTVIARMTWRF